MIERDRERLERYMGSERLRSLVGERVKGLLLIFRASYTISAGGGGFEPPLWDPESHVLPLDDPPSL